MEGRRPRIDDGGVGVPPPTGRLRFRPYREDDLENVLAMFSDEHGVSLWAVDDRKTGTFVGDGGLVWQDVDGERLLEIGYQVASARRGEALATEAARACLDHGFASLAVDRIVSVVHVANAASRAVAERSHAHVRKEIDRRGGRHRVYATTRKELDARAGGAQADVFRSDASSSSAAAAPTESSMTAKRRAFFTIAI